MGGRIGYSAATGIMVIVLSWFGIISVLLALVPVVAISPILLYIGMLIGAQAFQTTPATHAPAIVLALTPHLAAWCKTLMDGALGAAGTNAAPSAWTSSVRSACSTTGSEVLGRRLDPDRPRARRHRRLRDREEVRGGVPPSRCPAPCSPSSASCTAGRSGSPSRPTVAIAYAIVAAFLFGLSRAPATWSVRAIGRSRRCPAECSEALPSHLKARWSLASSWIRQQRLGMMDAHCGADRSNRGADTERLASAPARGAGCAIMETPQRGIA